MLLSLALLAAPALAEAPDLEIPFVKYEPVSYTHLTLPTTYSV